MDILLNSCVDANSMPIHIVWDCLNISYIYRLNLIDQAQLTATLLKEGVHVCRSSRSMCKGQMQTYASKSRGINQIAFRRELFN